MAEYCQLELCIFVGNVEKQDFDHETNDDRGVVVNGKVCLRFPWTRDGTKREVGILDSKEL